MPQRVSVLSRLPSYFLRPEPGPTFLGQAAKPHFIGRLTLVRKNWSDDCSPPGHLSKSRMKITTGLRWAGRFMGGASRPYRATKVIILKLCSYLRGPERRLNRHGWI